MTIQGTFCNMDGVCNRRWYKIIVIPTNINAIASESEKNDSEVEDSAHRNIRFGGAVGSEDDCGSGDEEEEEEEDEE
jgi:hypothetical protein